MIGGTGSTEPPSLGDEVRVVAHLEHAGELIRAQRLADAELEILRAVAAGPQDARALKLLALVRFKLGRLAEARETYRALAQAAPDDAGAHLNLGLIALKLDWVEEAVAELEVAVRLGPEDRRTWGYLGYAYARSGRGTLAAEAFRRAGQEELAREAERLGEGGVPPVPAPRAENGSASGRVSSTVPPPPRSEEPPAVVAAPEPAPAAPVADAREPTGAAQAPWRDSPSGFFGSGLLPRPQPPEPQGGGLSVEGFAPAEASSEQGAEDPFDDDRDQSTLTSFVLSRLLAPAGEDASAPATERMHGGVLRLVARAGTHVRVGAMVAGTGDLALAPAPRRAQGRTSEQPLGDGLDAFQRADGTGELWVAPRPGGELQPLDLEDDILYMRSDRVVAFDERVVWEAGRLPRDGMPLLQFRGSGRVVLDLGRDEFLALKVPAERPLVVDRRRLLGWVGRVVVQVPAAPLGAVRARSSFVTCEGEGVLLLSTHGEPGQPMAELAEPGDDRAGAAHPGRAAAHRQLQPAP